MIIISLIIFFISVAIIIFAQTIAEYLAQIGFSSFTLEINSSESTNKLRLVGGVGVFLAIIGFFNLTTILFGMIGVGIGMLLVTKSYAIYQFSGESEFATKLFGPGGGETLIKVVGVITAVLSVGWMSNITQMILTAIFSSFVPK